MTSGKLRTVVFVGLILVLAFSLMGANMPGGRKGGRALSTTLTGAAEVPGPGDPDGAGRAVIRLDGEGGMVCWNIKVRGITLPATAAHIHRGAVGVAGPVVVGLGAPGADGRSSGCTEASKELIKEIMQNPAGFYVNVHNADYPPGAVRGQLH